jgi:predicted PurR-regulated permease PerM
VIVGCVIGAVAGPLVRRLEHHRVPRAAGAAIVLLLVVALGIGILLLVLGGLSTQSASISKALNGALDEVESWLTSLGIKQGTVKADLQKSIPDAGNALVGGVVGGIKELASVGMLVTFVAFSTFFVLKDGPMMRSWIDRHMGVPAPIASIVTRNTIRALRQYFLGVTIVAAFNGVVVGLGALVLGVPLAGTIAVVTFVAAYVPFIGAWTAGFFAVALALAGAGTSAAIAMAIIVLLANGLLQQVVQPIAFGATLSLNPLVVLIATIGGGCLFGMVGLILAAPLTSAAVAISQDIAAAKTAPEPPPVASPAPSG